MKTEEEEKGYQGWKNYETWCVKLWIDNEGYNYWQERAKELKAEDAEDTTSTLADELKERHEEIAEEETLDVMGVLADLLHSALGKVDWYEIATSILKEVNE
jgi:acyl-CoA reductase-like NAD-dependent aldehyde dehydrogenase